MAWVFWVPGVSVSALKGFLEGCELLDLRADGAYEGKRVVCSSEWSTLECASRLVTIRFGKVAMRARVTFGNDGCHQR